MDRLGFCAEIGVFFGTVYTLMLVLLDDSLWGAQAVYEGVSATAWKDSSALDALQAAVTDSKNAVFITMDY